MAVYIMIMIQKFMKDDDQCSLSSQVSTKVYKSPRE